VRRESKSSARHACGGGGFTECADQPPPLTSAFLSLTSELLHLLFYHSNRTYGSQSKKFFDANSCSSFLFRLIRPRGSKFFIFATVVVFIILLSKRAWCQARLRRGRICGVRGSAPAPNFCLPLPSPNTPATPAQCPAAFPPG
jgi:hypothetical protein